MGTVDQRLQVLERELSRSRRLNRTLVVVVVGVLCIAGAQANPQDESKRSKQSPALDDRPSEARDQVDADRLRIVEAEEFVLVDRDDRPRVRMQMTGEGPAISMMNEEGEKRVELIQTNSVSGLRLLDAGEAVASLRFDHDRESARLEIASEQGTAALKSNGLSVRDAADRGRIRLSLLNGNAASLGLSDSRQGGPAAIEMSAGEGSRSVRIHGTAGHSLFSIFAADNGDSFVNMRHPDHDRSLQISTRPSDHQGPVMAFFSPANADGTGGVLPRLQMGLDKDRHPWIRMAENDGRYVDILNPKLPHGESHP